MLLIKLPLVSGWKSPRIDNGYIRILDQKIAAFGPMPAPNPDEGEECWTFAALTASTPGFMTANATSACLQTAWGLRGRRQRRRLTR